MSAVSGFVEALDIELPTHPVAATVPAVATAELKGVIEARVQAILDAHANNLIEGVDMGADGLAMLLTLARKPVSNEEFSSLAKKAIHAL